MEQLALRLSPKPRGGRGGARKGAGRPAIVGSESHRRRTRVSPDVPLHVTLRVAEGVWNLRAERCFAPIRRALAGAQRAAAFRVVHYSVQGNHLHLVVEADDHASFVFGLRSLTVRLARSLNRVMGRKGRVLAGRTHARALRTPTEVRNVLRYVLLNRTRHLGGEPIVDECSTGPWFADWHSLKGPVPRAGPPAPERVDSVPKTWLLRVGYRRAR